MPVEMSVMNGQNSHLAADKILDDAILESIGDGVIVVDPAYRIIVFNTMAEAMLGYRAETVMGKNYFDVVRLSDESGNPLPEGERPITLAVNHGEKTLDAIHYFIRKDMSKFPGRITTTPLGLEGKIVGAVMVFIDITKEKEIDRAKSEFISLASHQLRTPPTAIKWHTELLLAGDRGPISDDQRKSLEKIAGATERMIGLTEALLNVSRIELGTFAIGPERTSISSIVKSALDDVRPQIIEKKLQIDEQYGQNIPEIPVDVNLLRIVFENIISNAVKYTPENGNVAIGVSLDGESVLISIKDTGCGIPKKDQPKIFSKMYRAGNVLAGHPEGNGLGLYIAKAIMEASGGKIWFASEEGTGTEFFVSLPLTGMKKQEGDRELSFAKK